jgi:hypothetical protein
VYPVWGGMGPDVHRDLPMLDVSTGKLALAHATLGSFRRTFGNAPSLGKQGRGCLTGYR